MKCIFPSSVLRETGCLWEMFAGGFREHSLDTVLFLGALSESLPLKQSHESESEWEDGEELTDPVDGALR